MASVKVSIGQVGARGQSNEVAAFLAGTLRSEVITSSVASAAGSLVAVGNDFAVINSDGAVYVTAGADPTATAGVSVYVPADGERVIALRAGDKIAVIDA